MNTTPPISASGHQNQITVWVVEGNENLRLEIQDVINGHEGMMCPHAFARCEDALEQLNTTFAPDIVLMDISLKDGMNGIEGTAQIKALAGNTHIVMLTVHADNDKIFDAIRAGASGYLLKVSPLLQPIIAVGTPPPAPTSQNQITVWVVEDIAELREEIQDVINGHEGMMCPHAFARCEDALEQLNTTFAPDIVLMDISLKDGMNGIEGTAQIKALAGNTHIVMLTVHADNDKIFDALCAGASGYVLKGKDPIHKLTEVIETVHQGGAAMSPQVARRVLNMFVQHKKPQWNFGLTRREKEVVELLVKGNSNKQIADALFRAPSTIDTHIRSIYRKLHVHSRFEAIAKYYENKRS